MQVAQVNGDGGIDMSSIIHTRCEIVIVYIGRCSDELWRFVAALLSGTYLPTRHFCHCF